MEKGHLAQLRKAREGSRMVAGVIQVDRDMEEHPRQRVRHVQRQRSGWKPSASQEVTVSSIREGSVQTRGFIKVRKRRWPR